MHAMIVRQTVVSNGLCLDRIDANCDRIDAQAALKVVEFVLAAHLLTLVTQLCAVARPHNP
jgi:hypothetical protein